MIGCISRGGPVANSDESVHSGFNRRFLENFSGGSSGCSRRHCASLFLLPVPPSSSPRSGAQMSIFHDRNEAMGYSMQRAGSNPAEPLQIDLTGFRFGSHCIPSASTAEAQNS